MSREVITSYPLKCEGLAAGNGETPLKERPVSVSITVFQQGGDYAREVGCSHLKGGKCGASHGKACMHLFPGASSAQGIAGGKIAQAFGETVAIDPEKVRALREEKKFTQQQLADAARSGHSIIWKIERLGAGPTRTKISRAELIAEKLGVELNDILLEPVEKHPQTAKPKRSRGRRRAS